MSRRLTAKQRIFVDEYLRCWNATEAARRAGYSERSLRSIAAENLTKPDIQAEIKRRLLTVAMSADEVLGRLAEQARVDLGQFIRINDETGQVTVDLRPVRAKEHTHLIKSLRQTKEGLAIEVCDAQAALVHLGKHLQLFTENLNVRGAIQTSTVNIYIPDNHRDS